MSPFALTLMRHGAPDTPGLMLGRTDAAVTEAGIAACRERAQGMDFARIVSSDLTRALACAKAIGATRIDPRWRELDFGARDGRAAEDIDPAALSRFWDDPDRDPPPGGERWSALIARVAAALTDLAAGAPQPTLVVTHGGAMRAALSVLCGFSLAQSWALDLPYAAVLDLRVWPGPRPSAQIVGLR